MCAFKCTYQLGTWIMCCDESCKYCAIFCMTFSTSSHSKGVCEKFGVSAASAEGAAASTKSSKISAISSKINLLAKKASQLKIHLNRRTKIPCSSGTKRAASKSAADVRLMCSKSEPRCRRLQPPKQLRQSLG